MTSDTACQRIGIFCASNDGARPGYVALAQRLGAELATRGMTVVYGGGGTGLMGALANSALAAGGEVIGVMPHGLVQREVAHRGLTALRIVDSMHERKALIAELSDAFITLPGGIGTLEEFFETLTWAQLGVHRKPIGLLDIDRFWDPLETLFDHLQGEGFLRGDPRGWMIRRDDPAALLDALEAFDAPSVRRWIRLGET